MRKERRHSITSGVLTLVGLLALGHGASKGVLWMVGARATGQIVYQEKALSTRGATWTRYAFRTADGRAYDGRAMTGRKDALHARVQIAYLRWAPALNMPAYAGYTSLMGIAWTFTGLLCLVLARLFLKPRRPGQNSR